MRGVDMLIVSLKKHFPARWPEWFMAGQMTAWGCYIATHPELFTSESTRQVFAGMASMVNGDSPAAVWGLAAVVIGMTRAFALFINGAYTRTPLIRLVMSFLGAFIWTQVVIGLIKSGIPNADIMVYSGLVILDIVSAYRAATDVVYAEKARHDLKKRPASGVEYIFV